MKITQLANSQEPWKLDLIHSKAQAFKVFHTQTVSQYSQLQYMLLFLKKTTPAISFTADTGLYLLLL